MAMSPVSIKQVLLHIKMPFSSDGNGIFYFFQFQNTHEIVTGLGNIVTVLMVNHRLGHSIFAAGKQNVYYDEKQVPKKTKC